MMNQERSRVFVIGQAVVTPYQSTNRIIDSPQALNDIVFDHGSLLGVMPPQRRTPNLVDAGAIPGNFFNVSAQPNVNESLLNLLKPLAVNEYKANPPFNRAPTPATPEEAMADLLALKALESAGISGDIFLRDENKKDKITWIPKGEPHGKPIEVAIGITNSVGPIGTIDKSAKEGFALTPEQIQNLDPDEVKKAQKPYEKNQVAMSRGGLSGHVVSEITDTLGSPATPLLSQAACSTTLFQFNDGFNKLKNPEEEVDLAIVGGFELASAQLVPDLLSRTGASANITDNIPTGDGQISFRDHPEQASRPGDIFPKGMVMSEGGAAFVLATEAGIKRLHINPENILAEVVGNQTGIDGTGFAPPDPPVAMPRTIRKALSKAGLKPQDLQVAIFHGTGTSAGDKHDWNSWRDILGLPYIKELTDEPGLIVEGLPWVTLPKSITGHSLAASGGFSAITLFEIFKRGEIPATPNIIQPNNATVNLVVGENKKVTGGVNYGMLTAAGMDSSVAVTLFKRVTKEEAAKLTGPSLN